MDVSACRKLGAQASRRADRFFRFSVSSLVGLGQQPTMAFDHRRRKEKERGGNRQRQRNRDATGVAPDAIGKRLLFCGRFVHDSSSCRRPRDVTRALAVARQ